MFACSRRIGGLRGSLTSSTAAWLLKPSETALQARIAGKTQACMREPPTCLRWPVVRSQKPQNPAKTLQTLLIAWLQRALRASLFAAAAMDRGIKQSSLPPVEI
jgi:hypothetical protein